MMPVLQTACPPALVVFFGAFAILQFQVTNSQQRVVVSHVHRGESDDHLADQLSHDHSESQSHEHDAPSWHSHHQEGASSSHSHSTPRFHSHAESVPHNHNVESEQRLDILKDYSPRIIGCYFWESSVNAARGNNCYDISYIPVKLCTHIYYGFAEINASTLGPKILKPSIARQFVGKIYNESNVNHTAKPILSIGGPQEPYSSWRNVIASASSIQTFITASMAVLQQYGFQGVDINWQYPKAVDKDKFAVLVEAFKDQFSQMNSASQGETSYELFVSVNPASGHRAVTFNATRVCRAADYVNLITFDIHGAQHDNTTGYAAPMFAGPLESKPNDVINSTVHSMMEEGCPSKKLVLGIPMFGHAWALSPASMAKIDAGNNGVGLPATGPADSRVTGSESGLLNTPQICSLVSREGWTRGVDYTSGSYYAYGEGTWISYDSRKTIGRKISFIMLYADLGGAFVSALDQEDYRGICPCSSSTPSRRPEASRGYKSLRTISMISNKERLAGFVNRAPHMRYFSAGLSSSQQKMLSTLWLNRNLTALQAHVNITGFATFQTTS